MKKILTYILIVMIFLLACAGAFKLGSWPRLSDAVRNNVIRRELGTLINGQDISEKTFNIYYFGGSTMVGEPYNSRFSLPQLVSYMLNEKIGKRDIRYVNVAQPGRNLEYNVEHMKFILEHPQTFHASLCVIYSGHNEFIGYFISKNYVLDVDERSFFDRPLPIVGGYPAVIARYNRALTEANTLCREHQVSCIFSTVAGNYGNWEPNRSVFSGSEKDKNKFKHMIDQGIAARLSGNNAQAISYFRQALDISDTFAEAHYRLAQSYEALGAYAKAWEHYHQAVDYDQMPIRATRQQNDFIRRLPQDKRVAVVDIVQALRKKSRHGIIGSDLMIDGHHPNLEGYIEIAYLIAQHIYSMFQDGLELSVAKKEDVRSRFQIDKQMMFRVHISRGRWFTRTSTLRYEPSQRLESAQGHFMEAMKLDERRFEPYLGMAMCYFLKKDLPTANQYLSQAKARDNDSVREYMAEPWVKQVVDRANSRK